MSENGVAAIMAKLETMEREHRMDIAALNGKIDMLTEAHKKCASHCWVGNQDQIMEKLRSAG